VKLPLRLASVSMVLTVGMVTWVGVALLKLPLGAAVLLGWRAGSHRSGARFRCAGFRHQRPRPLAIFPYRRSRFERWHSVSICDAGPGVARFARDGETPFIGWRWIAVDVVWAIGGGLGIGALLGILVGRLVLYLRREHKEAVGWTTFSRWV
jgi:hypothetical protein